MPFALLLTLEYIGLRIYLFRPTPWPGPAHVHLHSMVTASFQRGAVDMGWPAMKGGR